MRVSQAYTREGVTYWNVPSELYTEVEQWCENNGIVPIDGAFPKIAMSDDDAVLFSARWEGREDEDFDELLTLLQTP